MKLLHNINPRRKFLRQSGTLLGAAMISPALASQLFAAGEKEKKITVNGHLWVYASKFPPNWDCTPNLEAVFADFNYAGMDGVELMESTLRYDDAVSRINGFINKYKVPVSGSSYGVGFNMWDASQHTKIMDDIKIVVPRLSQVKGKTFGISVGEAKRLKTPAELDAQATIVKQIIAVCDEHGIEANLHNHTYEVENGMHDLKGTMERIPGIKLGPDVNWLIRAGINPVDFINTYGKQIVYLHIRDQYADGNWTEYLGQGITKFGDIAKALTAQQFNGNAAVELAFPNNFTPENLLKEDWKMSRQYVKKTFGW